MPSSRIKEMQRALPKIALHRVVPNLRSVSLRFSAYLCVPLRLRLFQRRGRRGTQRTAEKKVKVRHYCLSEHVLFVLPCGYTTAKPKQIGMPSLCAPCSLLCCSLPPQ